MDNGDAGAVFGPFEEMWSGVLRYLPKLAAGLLIVLLGLIICWLVKKAVVRIVILLRLDRALRGVAWARGLEHADVRHNLAAAVGNVAAFLIFLVFLDNAVIVWQLEVLGRLIGNMVFYLPRVIIGGIVLLAGSTIATLVAGRVRTTLAIEGVARAGLVARLCQWGLMIVVAAFTLEELGIAPQLLRTAFSIGLGSLGLTASLAIGLGSRDAVAQMWRSFLERRTPDR
jgi:hypothetical protein